MKKIALSLFVVIFSVSSLLSQNDTVVLDRNAQPNDSVQMANPVEQPAPAAAATSASKPKEAAKPKETKPPKKNTSSFMKKVYFGGTFGATFGTYSSVRINPLIGYKLTPKLSVGVTFTYEYLKNKYYSQDLTSHNYGGSIFSRFRVFKPIYIHAEYAMISYENYYQDLDQIYSVREMVPFLFLGGGYSQNLGGKAWLNLQVLFDVIQSDKSPYRKGEPFFSVGVGVGF